MVNIRFLKNAAVFHFEMVQTDSLNFGAICSLNMK